MGKKSKTQIEIVNKLVRKSFGRGFSGDCIFFSNDSKKYMIKGEGLESIAKKKWPYIPKLNENYEVAGKFTSEDGSKLDVNIEYLNSAERYATCYSLYFNKSAWVNGKEISAKIKG